MESSILECLKYRFISPFNHTYNSIVIGASGLLYIDYWLFYKLLFEVQRTVYKKIILTDKTEPWFILPVLLLPSW